MRALLSFAVLLSVVAALSANRTATPADFPRTTIDVGLHVSDIEAAADFYRKVIGFTETDGFDVPKYDWLQRGSNWCDLEK